MATNIKIKQKGIFKKKLDINYIIFDDIGYGSFDDNYILEDNKISNNTLLYSKNILSRGFEVFIDNGFNFNLPLPTSYEEIRYFYNYIVKVCNIMGNNEFIRNDEVVNINNIEQFIKLDTKTSIDALDELKINIENGKYQSYYIFGIFNPIALGKKEIDEIGNDVSRLGNYLEKIQMMDINYTSPHIYKMKDNSLFGLYLNMNEVPTVYPLKPSLFTNNELKIDKWFVNFLVGNKNIGIISYENFINNVTTKYYDNEHVIVQLNKEEIENLLNKYKEEI